MTQTDEVIGMMHIVKLMRPCVPENLVPVDESFLDKINYYREGWCHFHLIKEKWNNEVVAYQRNSDGQLFVKGE